MKWNHKGHEFEDLGRCITSYQGDYAIWGAGIAGQECFDTLSPYLSITHFLDSDESKKEHCGIPVQSPKNLEGFSGKIIVASSGYPEISKMLKEKGQVENQDFFFWRKFLGGYFLYAREEVCLYRVDISVTNRCSLRCKYCNMLMPHFEKPQDQVLEDILRDIDTLFTHVDFVMTLKLLGGEPFLYPKFHDVLLYLTEHYKDKFGFIEIFTNGTLMPSEETISLIAKENIRVQVTDYTKAVDYSKKLKAVVEKLEENEITYTFYSLDKWLDFGFPHNQSDVRDENALIGKFHGCSPDFRGLVGNKLYFCHLSASAEKANLFQGVPSDYFVLEEGMSKAELMEFDLGYNDIGYVSYCTVCRGCKSDIFVDGNAQM